MYDRFASLVHNLAHRVLGDEKAADRITREVFGYIWENPAARAYVDWRLGTIGGGTDEVMKEVIAKIMKI